MARDNMYFQYVDELDDLVEITITGGSDDLIEIDGCITEEFNIYLENSGDRGFLAVSDGTLLSVQYDADGIWRFDRLVAGSAQCRKIPGDVAEDTFDIIRLKGTKEQIRWVVFGTNKAVTEKEQ